MTKKEFYKVMKRIWKVSQKEGKFNIDTFVCEVETIMRKCEAERCEICNGEIYNKLEFESSISICKKCDHLVLNGVGLPAKDIRHAHTVYSVAYQANGAMYDTFKSLFSPDKWEEIEIQWHQNLHNRVIK